MSDFPNRRTYAAAAVLCVAFVVYGSLVPFNFSAMSRSQAEAGIDSFLRMEGLKVSGSDLLTNIALLVPFGFALMGALTLDRTVGALPVFITLVLGTTVAFGAEASQVFFPDRNPSLADIYAQSVGNLLGIITWCAAGPWVTEWFQHLHAERDGERRATGVLALTVAAIVVANLLPLDLTIRPAELAAKYREGRILLRPALGEPSLAMVGDIILDAVSRVPFGMLAMIGWTRRGRRRDLTTAILLGILGVGLVEFVQIFVWTRVADVMDVVSGSVGVVIGCLVASAVWAGTPGARVARAPLAWIGIAVWLGCMAIYHWSPFDFRVESAFARQRLPEFLAVPFASYAAVPLLPLLRDVLAKMALAIVLGGLLRIALPSRNGQLTPGAGVMAMFFGAAVLVGFEVGQLLLPGRHADLTDVIVGLAALSVGLIWTGRFAESGESEGNQFVAFSER